MPDSTADEDRERRLGAVERELRRERDPDDERDLVDTVADEQRRERDRAEDANGNGAGDEDG